MSDFDPASYNPSKYGPVFAELLQCDRNRPLDEGAANEDAREALTALTVPLAFADTRVVDQDMARCCISGIWLLYDFLDESHTISQDITTTTGSYWHGIMHRREGDFSNSKYWFRKVGEHPIFEQLAELSDTGHWDPYAFIDACQSAINSGGQDQTRCQQLQQQEWQILFDHCYNAAIA